MGKHWTENEDNQLRILYPNTNTEELLTVFPGRTLSGIHNRAHLLQLEKSPEWEANYVASLRKIRPPKEAKPKKIKEPKKGYSYNPGEVNIIREYGNIFSMAELKMMLPRRTIEEIAKMKIELL